MSFISSFRWSELILAMRDGDRANEIKTMILIYGLTTKNFPHDLYSCLVQEAIG
jgi:hypothetical protein